MAQKPGQSLARNYLLHIAQAQICIASPSTNYVTLQDRRVRMIEPSDEQKQQKQQQKQEQQQQQQQKKDNLTTSSSTSATSTPSPSQQKPSTISKHSTTTSLSVEGKDSSGSQKQQHQQAVVSSGFDGRSSSSNSSSSSSKVALSLAASSSHFSTKVQSNPPSPSSPESVATTQTSTQNRTPADGAEKADSESTKLKVKTSSSKTATTTALLREEFFHGHQTKVEEKDAPPPTSQNLSATILSSSSSPTSSLLETSNKNDPPKQPTVSLNPPSPPQSEDDQSSPRGGAGGQGGLGPTKESNQKEDDHEEVLTLIVPDLTRHGADEVKSVSRERSPQTDESLSPSSCNQPQAQRQRSATTTSKLSTNENLQPEDQQATKQTTFRDRGNSEGNLNVTFSLSSPKRDEAHVMEFFQEQEKNLQESFLSLPKQAPRKQRSPSPNTQQKLGLEHLDNLVRLMQQLTSLKDENCRLRKRCDYLESTKKLLQAKKDLNGEGGKVLGGAGVVNLFPSSLLTTPSFAHKQHLQQQQQHRGFHNVHQHQQPQHVKSSSRQPKPSSQSQQQQQQHQLRHHARARLSSADEFDYLDTIESSSDQQIKHSKKKTLHKRSFSTGSIEIQLMDNEMTGDGKEVKFKMVPSKPNSKQKEKRSKWARVKKVLTGQKLYEDLNTTIKSLREFGRSSHIQRYPSHGSQDPRGIRTTRSYHRSDSIPIGHDIDFKSTKLSPPTHSGYQVMDTTTEAVDMTSDIWMGPPDWWEEYEANKEGATSASSDVSSVIEVTTMYLCPKTTDIMSTSQTTSTSTSSSSSFTTTTTQYAKPSLVKSSSSSKRSPTHESLSVVLDSDSGLTRRKSSPAFNVNDDDEYDDDDDNDDKYDEEDDQSLLELASKTEQPIRFLHKSSSCKSAELELPKPSRDSRESSRRFHRTAWGRVKDIIHTRKGSIKRKPKRDKSGIILTEPEETSEFDMEALLDESWHHDLFAEGLLSRSTPKSSPMIIRQSTTTAAASKGVTPETCGSSPPAAKSTGIVGSAHISGSSPGQDTSMDLTALLGRSLSDDFNKKMLEWEQMKSKKLPAKSSVNESEICSLDVSAAASQDIKTVDLKDLKGSIPEAPSESLVTDDSNTSIEVMGLPSVNTEDLGKKKMTESFSRKMEEWERMKYKGIPGQAFREPSPELERKGSKGRKDERQKSKRSREEKEKEKLERQREREMQKVEKEQIKLEKEKLRIEKERLRALEREAKLEKLKGRLSQTDTDNIAKNPVLSPLAEYKVTSDFAHKIHEWELRKGLSHTVSSSVYLEAHKIKSQLKEETSSDTSPRHEGVRFTFDQMSSTETQEGEEGEECAQAALSCWESTGDTSPAEMISETSVEDSSITAETRTTENIPTLERANAQLLQQLRKKELEYHTVQEDVQCLNEKLVSVKEEHIAEIEQFHEQLKEGSAVEPVKLEIGELEETIGEVEEKIKVMENVGESIAKSMESAAAGKWQSMEGEESVHKQLVELVAQMRNMLIQATQTEEASQKTSALTNFETLYSQSMKLQVQMNNLRLSHLERNREIMVIKRQLLLQEVNNLVLQADITRREAELYQFQQAKQHTSLRRWNTFSGSRSENQQSTTQAQLELPDATSQPKVSGGMTKSMSDKDNEMKRFQEPDYTPTTKSAPCSPLSKNVAEEVAMFHEEEIDNIQHSSNEMSTSLTETGQTTTTISTTTTATAMDMSCKDLPGDRGNVVISSIEPQTNKELQQQQLTDSQNLTAQSELSPSNNKGVGFLLKEQSMQDMEESLSISQETQQQQKFQEQSKSVRVPLQIQTEYKTQFDSVPLQQEIEALRKEKAKVEMGSPTLRMHKGKILDYKPDKSDKKLHNVKGHQSSNAEENGDHKNKPHPKIIPKQSSLDKKARLQKAAQINEDEFPTAQSVIECDDSHSQTTDHTTPITTTTTTITTTTTFSPGSESSDLSGSAISTSGNLSTLPPIADPSRTGSRSPRSPISKHKLLRRQKEKEERETKSRDYSAISPKGSPVPARGKPPLPRQERALRYSPCSSPCMSDRGSRSRSIEDVDGALHSPTSAKPLQDAIERFEKRATICETENRTIELRKTPSPTLHLPRVGLINRARKIQPAAELLEESQRYRTGQSIYATRIMPKYILKDESKQKGNKENQTGSYVQSMVQRLSRESTPARSNGSSRTTSNSSLHRTDHPRSQSEFVSQIVRKLSSSSGPDTSSFHIVPLSDLTNDGQVKDLTNTFTQSKSDPIEHKQFVKRRAQSSPKEHTHERKSCEVAMVLSQKNTSQLESLPCSLESAVSTGNVSSTTITSAIPTNHKSLPALPSSAHPYPKSSSLHEQQHRQPTTTAKSKSTGHKKDVSFDIEPEFSSITSASSVFRKEGEDEDECDEDRTKRMKQKRKKGESRRLLSSLSPVRKSAGRGRMETVGVLCKQSISFDLGVSGYLSEGAQPASDQMEESSRFKKKKKRKPRSWDPSESVAAHEASQHAEACAVPSTSMSTSTSVFEYGGDVMTSSMEGEIPPSSPTTTEKKKSKRFLDSAWLQKSKKFFKVSK